MPRTAYPKIGDRLRPGALRAPLKPY